MKKFIAALTFVLVLAMAPVAHAYDTPLTNPKDKAALEAVANAVKMYAEDLGCSQLAWGNISGMGAVYQLQFIPTGTDPKAWKQRVVMNVYGLPNDPIMDIRMITRLIAMTISSYERAGVTIVQKPTYTDVRREPLLFIEYETTSTVYTKQAQKEYGAGFLKRTSKNTAAFVLLQSRYEKISPNQTVSIHRMVNPKAK
ncbi:MAG: hypothetical protein ACAH80_18820 [Alphaproteobacteria bacterium]